MAVYQVTSNNLCEKTIEEIEQELGFDKVQSIQLTKSDSQDRIEKDEDFQDWYEEELREFYNDNK